MKKILLILAAVFLLLIGCPQDEEVSASEEVTASSSSSSDDGASSVSSSDTSSSDADSSDTSSSDTSSSSDSSSGSTEPAIISYKIYFNNNGGKGSMSTKSMVTDETWDLTTNQFTKAGYYFDSWNTQKDGSGESYADKMTVCNLVDVDGGKITLYAQWLPIHYIIEFYPNGGLGNVYTQDVSYDEVTTLIPNQFTALSAEKEFSYWTYTDAKGNITPFDNEDEVLNLSDTSGAIIKLYAQWSNAGEYPIVYTDDKNANNSNVISYTAADNVELIDLTNDTYRFLGWFSSSGAVDLNNKVTGWNAGEKSGPVFLWAKWCPKPSFNLTKSPTKVEYVNGEEALDLSNVAGIIYTYNEIGTRSTRNIRYSGDNSDPNNFTYPDITSLGIGTHTIECAYNPPELQGQEISSLTFTVTIYIIKARDQKNWWETTDIPSNFSLNHDFWDNANVYFVLTDRFFNGDEANDTSYGRVKGTYNTSADATKYYGGDIKGLTQKLDYLADTGINAIWITAPYEQIHGWVGGSYPYHGYWTLDWTQMDANVGTADEFRTFVDTAHAKGIRVIMDVVMNHPGYATLVDLKNLVSSGTEGVLKKQDIENANPKTYHDVYINYQSCEWHDWWGVDWVRAGFCEHYTTGSGDLQGSCGGSLPDFITESGKGVELSPMFTRKLADTTNYPREGYKVTDLTNDASEAGNYRMRDYMIKWLSDWVREFGIDGFRCDTAKHVEKDAWYQLKVACVQALRDWKSANPDKKVDDSDFWMTGEVFDHGVVKDAYFTEGGFDSLINFKFKDKIKNYFSSISGVDTIYSTYADAINTDDNFNALTYISSHDTTLCYNEIIKRSSTDTTTDEANNQKIAGSLLAFCPGAIQIYYGDECGRSKSKSSDAEQQTRSQMPWDEDGYNDLDYKFDSNIHAHWSKVLNFRKNHVAVGAGTHAKIADAPYTFSRVKGDDKVIVVLGASGSVEVDVSSVFENGTTLHNGEETATVANGKVTFTADSNGVILID